MRPHFVITCTAALLAGCTTVGDYVKPEQAQQLAGARTAEEVRFALGPPSARVPETDGKTLWVYVGQYKSPSPEAYIPLFGSLFGRENRTCAQLSLKVDDKTGAVSDMKYQTRQDKVWWARKDEDCP